MFDPIDDTFGTWYVNRQTGETFSVVAVDDESIQLQLLDGGLIEQDLAEWMRSDIVQTSAPINWQQTMDSELPSEQELSIDPGNVRAHRDLAMVVVCD